MVESPRISASQPLVKWRIQTTAKFDEQIRCEIQSGRLWHEAGGKTREYHRRESQALPRQQSGHRVRIQSMQVAQPESRSVRQSLRTRALDVRIAHHLVVEIVEPRHALRSAAAGSAKKPKRPQCNQKARSAAEILAWAFRPRNGSPHFER